MLAHCVVVLFLPVLSLAYPTKSIGIALDPNAEDSKLTKTADGILGHPFEEVLQHQANSIASMRAELSDLTNRMNFYASRMRLYIIRMRALDNNVTSLQNASKAVAFSATISASRDTVDYGVALRSHQTVVFDESITNIGNAYNTSSGIFTAPVAGTYAFSLSQMTPNKYTFLYLDITKNGATLLDRVFSGGNSSYDQGSHLVTTHLTAGDQVCVRKNFGSAVRGDYWTIFSGFLLQADLGRQK